MKKKCVVIGHFGYGKQLFNGQTIKTKSVTDELIYQLGNECVKTIDTNNIKRHIFKVFTDLLVSFVISDCIIMLPAHNGVKIFAPLLSLLHKIFGKKIVYIVIGGWLPQMVSTNARLKKQLINFNGIYVETNSMKNELEKQGFGNVFVMYNFKKMTKIKYEEKTYSEPYKLCTFSRVMKEKGIGDIVKVVQKINHSLGRTVYSLDIYGPVEPEQQEWFDSIMENVPDYINYKGVAKPEESASLINYYFALAFPTKFYTEGIPGTIIDAYSAGVPVISSVWSNYHDVVDEGKTGLGYKFDDLVEFENLLYDILKNPSKINNMRQNCLEKAKLFDATKVIGEFIERI